MTWTIYAYLTHPLHGVTDVAFVDSFNTQEEAKVKMDIDNQCYSDDGINYCMTGEDVDIPEEKLCSYESMIERVSK